MPVASGLAETTAGTLLLYEALPERPPAARAVDSGYRAYRDVTPVDRGFAGRRELWRLPAYLAVIAVDGEGSSAAATSTASPPQSGPTVSRARRTGRRKQNAGPSGGS